jgi:hypothetical protein
MVNKLSEQRGDDSHPSGRRAKTRPVPPAPPNGAIPDLIAVKITIPLASFMTLGGIFLRTFTVFFFFSPSSTFSAFSSFTIPSTYHQLIPSTLQKA